MLRDKGENHAGSLTTIHKGPGAADDEGNLDFPKELKSLNEGKENIIEVICGFSLAQVIKYH